MEDRMEDREEACREDSEGLLPNWHLVRGRRCRTMGWGWGAWKDCGCCSFAHARPCPQAQGMGWGQHGAGPARAISVESMGQLGAGESLAEWCPGGWVVEIAPSACPPAPKPVRSSQRLQQPHARQARPGLSEDGTWSDWMGGHACMCVRFHRRDLGAWRRRLAAVHKGPRACAS